MKALLRADWLRFRRRRDFWIIAILVCVIGAVTYVAAYHGDVTDPVYPDEAAIRQDVIGHTSFGGMTQAEIDAQVDQMVADTKSQYDQQRADWEVRQALALQKYDLPQSPITLIGSGLAPLLALILIASLAVGDEFRHGTIRTSLLAAGNRRRFLAARFISLLTMTVGLYAVLVVVGLALGLGLRLVGAEVRPSEVPIALGATAAWLATQILTTMVLISLAVALTLILRSGALPLLIIIIAGLVELFIANLPVFAPSQFLSGVPQAFLTTSIRTLTTRLSVDTHAVALAESGEIPHAAIDLPLVAVAAIIVGWGLVFLAIADRRFRRMDIVE